jgi:DNA modification methylase
VNLGNRVIVGDCVQVLDTLPAACAELLVTDPPFNIGYHYDGYRDDRPAAEFHEMLENCFTAARRVLTPTGSLFVAMGPKYQAELCVLLKRLGYHWRRTIVWHYTFGPAQQNNFTPSHVPIHYFTVHPDDFTFNADAIRVPAARTTTYYDRRANPRGKVPDDVWVLRPQEEERAFRPDSDTWHIPRVNGTFKERRNHPCQMPLAIMERIITVASNPGELVLDPFAGSGTTLVAAKRLGRRYLGIELLENAVRLAESRLAVETPPFPEMAV